MTEFAPNVGSTQLVDARTLGFQDVLDAMAISSIPLKRFSTVAAAASSCRMTSPVIAASKGHRKPKPVWSIAQQLPLGFGWTMSGNYLSKTCTGRLCTVVLPSSTVLNLGLLWGTQDIQCKLDVFNITNERYFRARTGDTLGNVLAQIMPDRQWQLTLNLKF